MNEYRPSRLEMQLDQNKNFSSKYYIIREKACEIIKWIPPHDGTVDESPPYYTDHGPEHSQRILAILDRLTEKLDLNDFEIFPLLCSVWLHDVGMFTGREIGESYEKTRKLHNLRSVEYINEETQNGRLPLDQWHLPNVLDICRAHRSKVNFDDTPKIPKQRPYEDGIGIVRVQLLCSLLRLADACDIHHSRAPEAIFQIHEALIPKISKEHWKKHFRVGQVRFNWKRACIEICINLSDDDIEKQNEQKNISIAIQDELNSELKTIDSIFEQYNVRLFYVEIIDYLKGEYLDLSHITESVTVGWSIQPFAEKSSYADSGKLIFKPILTHEEVTQCYVETPSVKELVNNLSRNIYHTNYLFLSHPRTGKTSMLSYLSALAKENGYNVYWFSKQSNIPSVFEVIDKVSREAPLDETTIIVFDNIHEDAMIIELIEDLINEKPKVTVWCASRISEFTNLKDKWDKVSDKFTTRELPGYLDKDSINKFLDKFKDLLDDNSIKSILEKENVTPYYLANIYIKLKEKKKSSEQPTAFDLISEISIDQEADNQKVFGCLTEIERFALKIISYAENIPKDLLESLLIRTDPIKGKYIVDSLLSRKIIYLSDIEVSAKTDYKIVVVQIFDSLREYILKQMYEHDKSLILPELLLAEAKETTADFPYALLSLSWKYRQLSDKHIDILIDTIIKKYENSNVLWIASYLSKNNKRLLSVADYAFNSQSPNICRTIANFARSYYKFGDTQKAISFLERAVTLNENRDDWIHILAHYYEDIDIQKSIVLMKKISSKNDSHLICLSNLYYKCKEYDKALECFMMILMNDPENYEILNNIGIIYRIKEDYETSILYFKKALAINPNFLFSLRGIADSYLRLMDFESAKEYLVRATKVKDADDVTWYELASTYHDLNETNEALKSIQKAIDLSPEIPDYYYLKGIILDSFEDIDKKIESYDKAISLQPNHVQALLNRGASYFNEKGQYGIALLDFHKALTIDPSHSLGHVSYGNVYATLGEYNKAKYEYELALTLDTGSELHAHSYAKSSLLTLNALIESIIKKIGTVKSWPNKFDTNTINSLMYSGAMAGLYDNSFEIIDLIYNDSIDSSYLIATIGLLHFRQGDIPLGKQFYEKSLTMDPDNKDLIRKFYYEFGRALRINSQFDESLENLRRALSIDSNYVINEQIQVEILKASSLDNTL